MSENNATPFVLVDGSSYLFRAYHALPPLTNSKGQPTGAAYGVINMLRRLLKDHKPEHLAVVFDTKGKTFRHDMYPEYKANRPPMPDELANQIEPLLEMVRAMGLPLLLVEGVEADDVIGTLSHMASERGIETLISTGDKDMAQLVNPHVTLVNTMTNVTMDRQGVIDKFGVPPELIVDYLALIGDTVDNVPGVPKVGPKTAVKWLDQYKTLDNIMANADEFKGKVGEYLRDSLATLPLSKDLVTIKCDVELPYTFEQLSASEPDNEKLIDLFKQMEFKTWLAQVLKAQQGSEQETSDEQQVQYDTVLDKKAFNSWLTQLKKADVFAFDTETTSLNYMDAQIVGLSFAVQSHKAAYVPVAHDYEGAPEQLDRDWVLEQLRPLLEDANRAKVGQNLKYDKKVLANHGVNLQGIAFDTMLEAFILTSGNRNDMDSLALKYLGHNTIHFEDIAGKGAKQLTFNQIPLDKAAPYAAEDADITLRLHQTLWPRLEKQSGLTHVFREIEMPLVPVLANMERQGVLINSDMLLKQSEELAERIKALQDKAHQLADCVFNLSSPKQLQEILFEKMALPIIQKTPKGQPSTAENVLQELAHDYPLPKIILEYRSLSKLKSTYTDTLPEQVNQHTGRVHTSYHQAGAATGRFSSSDPNLQNIPARTDEGRRIRQAFIAPENHCIIAADYSQIELRIMAHLSQDKGLLDAFANGLDIHKATASEVFGIPMDKVDANHRRSAKAINFGLIYGMSAFGLSKQLDIERSDAQAYMDQYFHRYPGVKQYMENTRNLAHDKGYVETFFGRRLYLPEINSSNHMRKKAAERAAINAPMQGTSADIIKMAMAKVANWLKQEDVAAKMIMQVHDELVFEVADSAVELCQQHIPQLMCDVAPLSVPLLVDVGTGANWDEAHD